MHITWSQDEHLETQDEHLEPTVSPEIEGSTEFSMFFAELALLTRKCFVLNECLYYL